MVGVLLYGYFLGAIAAALTNVASPRYRIFQQYMSRTCIIMQECMNMLLGWYVALLASA